ncbi:MAG: hypothetical protein ACI39R_09380 [Lachnospiraceae bacterium]
MSRKKKIIIVSVVSVAVLLLCILIGVIYVNSGYRTAKGSFSYKLTFNSRKYEFLTSSNSLDMYQIKDLASAESDCYIYVGQYDPTQNLQETLDIVNKTDGTNLSFMTTTIGSNDYPATFVSYMTDEGAYANIYYVDYEGHNFVISTLTDKKHQKDIEQMLASFTITE